MTDAGPSISPISATGAIVGAMAVAASGISVTYSQSVPYSTPVSAMSEMSPQDHTLFDAKIEAKVADLRGDIRLNTQGLSDLRSRFDDLAKRMADVPADIASLKVQVANLPTKDWIGAHFRNWILGSVGFLTLVSLALKFVHVS